MPRDLLSMYEVGKNKLYDTDAWILLVKVSVRKRYRLGYDNKVSDFSVGATLTGGTSGASGVIIKVTTSYLHLYEVVGDFQDNETITDDSGGEALANGTLESYPTSYLFARNTEDVTVWSGYTYSARAIELDTVKGAVGSDPEFVLKIGIGDFDEQFTKMFWETKGFPGEYVTLRYVYQDDFTETDIPIQEEYQIASSAMVGPWMVFSLKVPEVVSYHFPRDIYTRKFCRHKFKDSSTCQYSGSATSCGRTLADCIELGNESHFGGFPAIPGAGFDLTSSS